MRLMRLMKYSTNRDRWLTTAIIIAVDLIFWAIPSNLAYNVAQQRDILLGRYTVDRFTTLLLLTLISALVLGLVWSKKKKRKKEDLFRLIAVSVSVMVSIVAADIFMRVIQHKHYVGNPGYYHRQTNRIYHGVTKDVPPTAFSYPKCPAGYGDIEYTLTVDHHGFRNKSNLKEYDMVVLGDSFAEGSGISDEQIWPVLLASKTNCTVYNLGMSGGNPTTYLETLKRFGLALSPKIVVCLLYEGNDFRDSNFTYKETSSRWHLRSLYETSTLRHSIKKALIRCFGPINSNRPQNVAGAEYKKVESYPPSHPLYAVSWLPLAIPDGPDARYYAFKIKRLLAHFRKRDEFLHSVGCQQTLKHLQKIRKICAENNIRLIIMYAPDKPHTLLPLVKHQLSPEQVRAFMALKETKLPPARKLLDILLKCLETQESVIEQFCRRESLGFISLTEPLRQKILEAKQAYFTYDQHWTPIGHEIVADALHRYLENTPKKPMAQAQDENEQEDISLD